MAHLIPVEAVREHQLAEQGYRAHQEEYKAERIAHFEEQELPLIVQAFIDKTRNVDDTRLYDNVLCLYIFDDLAVFKDNIVCEYALRHALQQHNRHVTDVYIGDHRAYGTPHDEDMRIFNVFVFFEHPESREEESAG